MQTENNDRQLARLILRREELRGQRTAAVPAIAEAQRGELNWLDEEIARLKAS